MGRGREGRVYRFRQLPLHRKDCGDTARFLASIAPVLGSVDNISVFSLAQEKSNSKTATVTFGTTPSIFDNDGQQWTLQAKDFSEQNIIVDIHFRGFTVLNEPQQSTHIADCIAISGLASHPFGSWKYRESGSDFMWLRDRLPKDVTQLRSLIYGYDTQLFKSRSFQDLDDIARSFIANLKELRRSLPPARPLHFLAHSLGGIVLKRALVLLAHDNNDEEKMIFESVKGLVFFGVPHKGMEISHFLAMVAKQPNEDLISRTLSPGSTLLLKLDEEFSSIASSMNQNIRYVYETQKSQLTEQTSAGTWVRSSTSYAVLVDKDSAIPAGTLPRNAIAVNEDHSNMVKFGEDDTVYQVIKSFLFDLSKKVDSQRSVDRTPIYSSASQTSPLSSQHPGKDCVDSIAKGTRPFSTIPFSKDPGFVGREDILAQLETEFGDPMSQNWASLYGLGGIGKSQIAIEYSYRRKERSPQLSTLWVHASSKARFEQSLVEIATRADIPGTGDGRVDSLQLVSKWLADEHNGPWLLILDNADDATVLLDPISDTENVALQCPMLGFLPRVQHGAVVVTTRDRNCALSMTGYRGSPIEVLSMSLNESVELLRCYLPKAHQGEASELVQELDSVPLAISQAGAYIKRVPRVSIPKYLEIFRCSGENKVALLNKNMEDLRRDPGVPNAVVTSWELSFNLIRKSSPKSAELLSLMSYFNRQAIPRFLIQGDTDGLSFEEDINILLSFSLIRAEIREDTFEIHRLVQIAMQHWLRSEGYEQLWRELAIHRVAHHFPWTIDQTLHWPICEDLMSHADEVILYPPSSTNSKLNRADILTRTAWYSSSRKGDHVLAEQKLRDALQIQRQYCDEGSGIILTILSTLALAQAGLGKLEEAILIQESVSKQYSKGVGPIDELALAASLYNLAASQLRLGHYEKARVLMNRVFEIRERLLDLEDHELLSSEMLLASIYLALGKYKEAEKLETKVLEITTRCHGFEHPNTLIAMMNLSNSYFQLEKLEDAERLISKAIPFYPELFGPSHVKTLSARHLLAEVYYRQGRLDEAKEVVLSSLDTVQSFHSRDELMVKSGLNMILSRIYSDQGNFIDAISLLKPTVESVRKTLGADHPCTLPFMSNLAVCYHDMGDNDHAIQLMSEVLDKQREVLPANHPRTANAVRQLAAWKGEKWESTEWETEEEGSEEEANEEDAESREWETETERSEEEANEEEGSEEENSEQDEGGEVNERPKNDENEIMREQLANIHIVNQDVE